MNERHGNLLTSHEWLTAGPARTTCLTRWSFNDCWLPSVCDFGVVPQHNSQLNHSPPSFISVPFLLPNLALLQPASFIRLAHGTIDISPWKHENWQRSRTYSISWAIQFSFWQYDRIYFVHNITNDDYLWATTVKSSLIRNRNLEPSFSFYQKMINRSESGHFTMASWRNKQQRPFSRAAIKINLSTARILWKQARCRKKKRWLTSYYAHYYYLLFIDSPL